MNELAQAKAALAASEVKGADEHEYPASLAAMEAVMKRGAFTFAEVHAAGTAALPEGSPLTCYRWADRLLQAYRKAGFIEILPGRKGWRYVRGLS